MDDIFRKLIRPVDARSHRGVFSRGKPIYGSFSSAPKPANMMKRKPTKVVDYAAAIKKRYANEYRNR